MTSDRPSKLDQKAISLAIEMGLSTQVEDAKTMEVEVESDLSQAIQGEAHSVSIESEDLAINPNLHLEELTLRADEISVNPLSAVIGKIELDRPVDATARLVLTEEDINTIIQDKITSTPNFQLDVEGTDIKIAPQRLKLHFTENGKIVLAGDLLVGQGDRTRVLSFEGCLKLKANIPRVLLEAFKVTHGEGLSPGLGAALLQKMSYFINQPQFHLPGMTLTLKQLEIQAETLTILAAAHIENLALS